MNTISFEQWKSEVDSIVYKNIKQHLEEIPDEEYRNYFDINITSEHMARIVIYHYKNNV